MSTKNLVSLLLGFLVLASCDVINKPLNLSAYKSQKNNLNRSSIDLVTLDNDRIKVRLQPAPILEQKAIFYIPETIPGTYSDDDYGKFIDSVVAYGSFGQTLRVNRTSDNTWEIDNARTLDYITYYVNDTFDTEQTHSIFSPAGTNFEEGKQYLLNLHGILGYFKGQLDIPYYVDINTPQELEAVTSLPRFSDSLYTPKKFINEQRIDTYKGDRYFDIVDNPILYNSPNKEIFQVDGITIELGIYSPNQIIKASQLKSTIERMIKAQKKYLGSFDATEKYTILLYLTSLDTNDAQGLGALEHHNSTVVVLPELMPLEELDAAMVDIVSHEFFHIITPLNLHSTEIHKFKYNDPEMSKHLWMYEGITEYFAQHFQVQQGLISPETFYEIIVQKINNAKGYQDVLSFTKMSENILQEPYASNYGNVYEKGALIGMCLDILMRKNSNGERGILDVMKQLTYTYGTNRPFEDDALIPQITKLTYPEIGEFFTNHVIGSVPIDYKDIFDSVGLEYSTELVSTGYFLDEMKPFIGANSATNEIYILPSVLNTFLESLGLLGNDIIKSIDGKEYSLNNVNDLIIDSNNWVVGDTLNITITRDEKEMELEGTVIQPQIERPILKENITYNDNLQLLLRKSWLEGN